VGEEGAGEQGGEKILTTVKAGISTKANNNVRIKKVPNLKRWGGGVIKNGHTKKIR